MTDVQKNKLSYVISELKRIRGFLDGLGEGLGSNVVSTHGQELGVLIDTLNHLAFELRDEE